MNNNVTYIDVLTLIVALMAAITAIYSAITNKYINEKNTFLDNYTSERLKNVYDLKKYAGIILSEASKSIYMGCSTETEKKKAISRITKASDKYWFLLKPIYKRDNDTLQSLVDLKNELLSFYSESDEEERVKHIESIKTKSIAFRKMSFLYIHSSWTCIKRQMIQMERSEYPEFNDAYINLERKIEELPDYNSSSNINLWDI